MKTVLLWVSILSASFYFHDENVDIVLHSQPLVIGAFSLIGYVIYFIVMVIIAYLTAGSGGSFPPATAKQFESPELTVSNPIPILFGTQFIKNTNVVWYGAVKSTPWEKCYG